MSALIGLHKRERGGRLGGGSEGGRESNTMGAWIMDTCAGYEGGWVSRLGSRLGCLDDRSEEGGGC